jgi:hypothetical protein
VSACLNPPLHYDFTREDRIDPGGTCSPFRAIAVWIAKLNDAATTLQIICNVMNSCTLPCHHAERDHSISHVLYLMVSQSHCCDEIAGSSVL